MDITTILTLIGMGVSFLTVTIVTTVKIVNWINRELAAISKEITTSRHMTVGRLETIVEKIDKDTDKKIDDVHKRIDNYMNNRR